MNCKRKKKDYDQSVDRFDDPSPLELVFLERFLMVYKPVNARGASLIKFPCFAVDIS